MECIFRFTGHLDENTSNRAPSRPIAALGHTSLFPRRRTFSGSLPAPLASASPSHSATLVVTAFPTRRQRQFLLVTDSAGLSNQQRTPEFSPHPGCQA